MTPIAVLNTLLTKSKAPLIVRTFLDSKTTLPAKPSSNPSGRCISVGLSVISKPSQKFWRSLEGQWPLLPRQSRVSPEEFCCVRCEMFSQKGYKAIHAETLMS